MKNALHTPAAEVPYQASPRVLARACAVAALAAGLILVLFVLPAERGIDPTGVGAALGLTQMRDAKASAAAPAAPAEPTKAAANAVAAAAVPTPDQASISKSTALRSDEMTVVVRAHTGVEVKARMKAGDHLVFRWEGSGPVKMDMHGERPDAGDQFTRYWLQADLTSGQGAFTAPFDGRHGWFWRNRSDGDVTIKVRTWGFYESLFQPK